LTRSLNVSFIDDPYLAVYFKRFYDKNIKGEVDELNIHINGENLEVIDFINRLWTGTANNILTEVKEPKTINHGEALNELYKIQNGDIFIIMDSDNFVYKKGIVDEYCQDIENLFDYVGSNHPYMCFFRAEMLDDIKVDFREEHENGRFHDTMENLLVKIAKYKRKFIAVDVEGEYEHIGRLSAFPMFVNDCWLDKDKGISRPLRKLFGRANRVALIRHIFKQTKDEVDMPLYNNFYQDIFFDVCNEVGHKIANIDKIIKEKYET